MTRSDRRRLRHVRRAELDRFAATAWIRGPRQPQCGQRRSWTDGRDLVVSVCALPAGHPGRCGSAAVRWRERVDEAVSS